MSDHTKGDLCISTGDERVWMQQTMTDGTADVFDVDILARDHAEAERFAHQTSREAAYWPMGDMRAVSCAADYYGFNDAIAT